MAVEIGRGAGSVVRCEEHRRRIDRHDTQRAAGRLLQLVGGDRPPMRAGTLAAIAITVAAATLLFHAAVHQIASVWLDVMLRPEVRDVIERSLVDQKTLRDLDRANESHYRSRFDETQRLVNRIDVVSMNRERVMRRFELALSGTFGTTLFMATFLWTMRHRRNEERQRGEYLDPLPPLPPPPPPPPPQTTHPPP